MRKVLGLSISAAAILATGLLPAAAFAAMTSPASIAADTPVTFTVANGGISISAPTATAALSDPAIGGTATGSLGVVEVTDAQGLDGGTWNVEASTSTFITGAGTTTPETIPITDVGYDPGAVGDMTITGTVTVTPTDVTIAGGGLTGDVTVVAASDIVGNDTVSWNPVITVLVPSTNVSGAYAGTITNSLA